MKLLRKYIRALLEQDQGSKGSLVVVDIQPEYESNTPFDIGDMLRTAAEDYSRVLFLFNGEDTLGMVSESALKNFYLEKLDYDEEAFDELLSKSEFFDKGYGFFRDVMDSDVCFDRNQVVKIVKYMIDKDIQDIRDLEEEDIEAIGVSELLFDDLEDYGFWVPELSDELPKWSGSDLAGGARNECMAEVEILGAAQGLSFNHVDQFIYEGDNRYTEVLRESRFKQMSKSKFTDLKQALAASSFLDADPEGDMDDDSWSSEAAVALRNTLNDYFDSKFKSGEITAVVKVDMMPTSSTAGKDSVLKGAVYYFEDGLHFIEVLLANIEDGSTLRDVGKAEQKVYEVIMHELLHMQQFLKFSRGKPTPEAWNAFKENYEKAGGAAGMGKDYFFFDDPDGPSELETFALQMATELVDDLGKEEAVKLLQLSAPDYNQIRDSSSSFRNIEKKSPDISRIDLRDMIKRAKQYAKRM